MSIGLFCGEGMKKHSKGRVCLPENTRADASADTFVGAFGRANPAPTWQLGKIRIFI